MLMFILHILKFFLNLYFVGLFGFLTYEVEGGKKLFFHTSEVTDGIKLHQGDLVEFVLVVNQRSGKSSGCNVTKIRSVLLLIR